jgi:hypothetical protein
MDGAIPLLRQVDVIPEERLTSRSRDPIHLAATLTMTIAPNTPVETNPPMPTEPRQMCHALRVGEPTIGGQDDPTIAGKPRNHWLQHLLLYFIGHTAAGVFQAFPHQRHRSSTRDDRDAHQPVGVPEHGGIQGQISARLSPLGEGLLQQGTIEGRHGYPLMLKPSGELTHGAAHTPLGCTHRGPRP